MLLGVDRRYQHAREDDLQDQYAALSLLLARREFADPATRPRALQERYDTLVAEFRRRGVQLTLFP